MKEEKQLIIVQNYVKKMQTFFLKIVLHLEMLS